jgi:hypothetical protein
MAVKKKKQVDFELQLSVRFWPGSVFVKVVVAWLVHAAFLSL